MDLLVIRHADAGDAAAFAKTGRPDDERPLSDDGRRKMRKGAQGLREAAPEIAVLASSPLLRARQTAEIVADAYGGLDIEIVPALRPDQTPDVLARWLGERRGGGAVAVVGHEPHLSTLVGWLVTGAARSILDLKKGAACLVSCEQSWGAGTAVLRWALTAGLLRALRE